MAGGGESYSGSPTHSMNSVERWLGESILCPLNIVIDDSDDKKIKVMTSTMTKQIHINEHTKSNGK